MVPCAYVRVCSSSHSSMSKILVTGARGQIGSDLVRALRERHGADAVVATDLLEGENEVETAGPTEVVDIRDYSKLDEVAQRHNVDTVYHLASLLSARGEQAPDLAWEVNVGGLRNVLELARENGLHVFWPSSIAVFGPTSPKHAPQRTILEPTTIYGVTKVAGELLCQYYFTRFGVDVRSLRYPGLISYGTEPGGGTTDYAVEIFHAALERGEYTCFLEASTRLPMMYMPDAVRATIELMAAEADTISVRTSYNVSALSFSAEELAASIATRMEGFTVRYEPDFRQDIAASWPSSIDDADARKDWNWLPAYNIEAMVDDMLVNLRRKLVRAGNE